MICVFFYSLHIELYTVIISVIIPLVKSTLKHTDNHLCLQQIFSAYYISITILYLLYMVYLYFDFVACLNIYVYVFVTYEYVIYNRMLYKRMRLDFRLMSLLLNCQPECPPYFYCIFIINDYG